MKLNLAHRALLIMALFSSCTENTIQLESVKQDTPTNNRTIEEILDIARNAPSTFESAATRSGQKTKEIDATSLKAIPGKQTRSGESISSSLYAINYADNDGYVIISGNQATPGVIAYIEEGQYDVNEIQDGSTDIGYVTDLATAYVATVSLPLNPIQPGDPDTLTTTIGPFITTKWGQSDPEGLFCPNGLSGCTNTAMAQIMAYYEYPETLQLTYPGADKDTIILNWNAIKKHTIRHTKPGHDVQVFCRALAETHNNISRLCRQLGELNKSTYLTTPKAGTSTHHDSIISTIDMFDYYRHSQDWLQYNDSCTIGPISRLHPLLMRGHRIVGNTTVGHVWLLDGLKRLSITRKVYLADGGYITENENQIYNHINWGWDGVANGYILTSIFDPNRMFELDPSIYGTIGQSRNYERYLEYLEFSRILPNN